MHKAEVAVHQQPAGLLLNCTEHSHAAWMLVPVVAKGGLSSMTEQWL